MPRHERTITEFIIEEQRRNPGATGGFTALLNDIRLACKRIAHLVGKGDLAEESARLPDVANEAFVRTNEWGGHLAAMASAAQPGVHPIPAVYPRGRYLLAFDALCGAPGLAVNSVAGSLFSVLRLPEGGTGEERDFLQPAGALACAGYAIYGPTTMLVLALASGVNGFTLDREIGEFILTHPGVRVPEETDEITVSTSDARRWEPALKRYVDECLAGAKGPRGRDFTLRWGAPLVAAVHRILLHGGVYLGPQDPEAAGQQVVFGVQPLGWLIERAGGRSCRGAGTPLDAIPQSLHETGTLIFGSRAEVERLDRYFRDHNQPDYDAPLFGTRGLFRASMEA